MATQAPLASRIQAPKPVFASEASVQSPRQLTRHIVELSNEVVALARAVIRVPIAFGNLLTNVNFSAGVASHVQHGLGRPYLGYIITASHTPASGTLVVSPLPSGKTTDKFIGLTSAVTATFDILVF